MGTRTRRAGSQDCSSGSREARGSRPPSTRRALEDKRAHVPRPVMPPRVTWDQARTGANVEVTVQTFGRLSADQRRVIASEADGRGEFLGAPTTVSYA
jgi:hypothetical protein